MSRSRRSTAYDAAALRLHPSGVRAASDADAATAARRKRPVADARGNWIAGDAGGSERIAKRRRVNVDNNIKTYKDRRAARRAAFEHDWGCLEETQTTTGQRPSSDFLKCIHYFASQYYAAKGELFDSAGDYRREKKETRRLKMMRMQAQEGREPVHGSKDTATDEKDNEEQKVDMNRTNAKVTQRDMHKAFDGSALLCIGMLLQSYISSRLAGGKPKGWDEEDDSVEDGGVPTSRTG